ncbi:MAG TPA: hypothetical protein VHE83_00885 [Mycobacteriales bacterium]|nr:hypothetical protein [Mycobacteriales bacterium]
MIVIGVLLLAAAAVVTVVGVLHNHGSGHALGSRVEVLGYHLDGSTGKLLLAGVVVGAVGMLGLSMMVGGAARHRSRARALRAERRELRAAADAAPAASGYYAPADPATTAMPATAGRHAEATAERRHWWSRHRSAATT